MNSDVSLQQIIHTLINAGWTQEQIARKAGVKQPTLNRIYRGRTENPRLNSIKAIYQLVGQMPPKQFDSISTNVWIDLTFNDIPDDKLINGDFIAGMRYASKLLKQKNCPGDANE